MKKSKVKKQARRIVLKWLEAKLGIGCYWMRNEVALAEFNSRAVQNSPSLVHAANVIQPGFAPVRKKSQKPQPKIDKITAFYKTAEWKRVRYDALAANDGRCELCGISKHEGAVLNVDHIRPLRLHWDRRLDPSNLQVLCGSCNQGKGNRDDTDWREPSLRVLMGEGMK